MHRFIFVPFHDPILYPGQEGVANLMKDPQMMAMAQKMMQNPAALQQAMSMLGGSDTYITTAERDHTTCSMLHLLRI